MIDFGAPWTEHEDQELLHGVSRNLTHRQIVAEYLPYRTEAAVTSRIRALGFARPTVCADDGVIGSRNLLRAQLKSGQHYLSDPIRFQAACVNAGLE